MTSIYEFRLKALGFMPFIIDAELAELCNEARRVCDPAARHTFYYAHLRTYVYDEYGNKWFALGHVDLTMLDFTDRTEEQRAFFVPLIKNLTQREENENAP